jgi:hypothetical protein
MSSNFALKIEVYITSETSTTYHKLTACLHVERGSKVLHRNRKIDAYNLSIHSPEDHDMKERYDYRRETTYIV